MLMVKDGNDYSLIGGYVDNTIKNIVGNTQVSSESETEVTKSDVVIRTITKEFSLKTGMSNFPPSLATKYLLYTPFQGGNSKRNKETLPIIVYAVQVSQNTMQTIIQNSKSRTTLASGELVMVPIVTIYNVLTGKQISENIAISPFQSQLLQMTIGILQSEKILLQIADARQIKDDYYDDNLRKDTLKGILSDESIDEIDEIIRHNIKFMLGIFFSSKNSFSYSGIEYIVNSVDWNDKFKQLKNPTKLLKRMNASYYIDLVLFLEKLEQGKLPSDRKGTFLESCGVKGALIRNEWKRNFETKTLDEWKKVFGFGEKSKDELEAEAKAKAEGKGEGIFDKLLPSFVKKAIKSIQNPLMSPLDAGVLQLSLIEYSLLPEEELQQFYSQVENSFSGVTWKNDNVWEKRKQKLFTAMDESMADVYCFQNVQCSLGVYKKCIEDAKLTQEQTTKLQDINNPITYKERLSIYLSKIHDALISAPDPNGANCIRDIYEKYKDLYEFVYFFEQVFYSSENFNKNPNLSSLGVPNMLYPEYDKKVALGNLTMVKKSKFEVVKNLRYDVRMGATFCSDLNKKKFSKFFPDLLKQKYVPGITGITRRTSSSFQPSDNFREQYESMCKNKSFGTMVYIKFRSSAPPVVSEPEPEPEPEPELTRDLKNAVLAKDPVAFEEAMDRKMEEDEIKMEQENDEIINGNVDESSSPGSGSGTSPEQNQGENSINATNNNDLASDDVPSVYMEVPIHHGGGGGAPSWYDRDTTEAQGYAKTPIFGKISSAVSSARQTKDKPMSTGCFNMKDSVFIPTSGQASKQLFGICNMKFDTKDVVIPSKPGVTPGATTYLPEDVVQVILMAVFLNKLKNIMQQFSGLGVLTNFYENPFIVSGFF